MNYKVLYRKYRPKNFDEIVGQNNTVQLLKECIINDKISHAYIFSGPRGTGKTSSAKIFAKTVNCLNPKDGNPCEECENCKNFATSSDIYEIDAASNNGVDQIREIVDNIKLTPISSKYKVYIIDEVHMLSTSAFNALLLTLEEPPSHVIFILATTDIENVPITVLSRCQRMDFRKVSTKDLINLINEVSKKEKIKIDDDAVEEIAEYVDGGVRDALSILDQVSKNNKIISREIILNSLGSISEKAIEDLVDDIFNNDIDKVTSFVTEVRDKNIDFKVLIKKTINVLEKKAINSKKKSNNDIYQICKNLCVELSGLSIKSSVNVDLYTLFELIIIGYMNNDKIISREIIEVEEAAPSKNEEAPKKRLGNNISHLKELINVRINNCFVDANKKYLEANKISWNEFVTKISDRKVKSLITDFEPVLASDRILVLKNDFEDKVIKFNENLKILEKEWSEIMANEICFIGTNSDFWNEEMEKYKENLKNKIKYEYMPEPDIKVDEDVYNIFEEEKLEIKEG